MKRLIGLFLVLFCCMGLFGPKDDILFIYPSESTKPEDYPKIVEGIKQTGIDKVLLLSSIVQNPRWEGLVNQIKPAVWGQVGTHYYPYSYPGERGDYPAQIVRAKALKCDWFGYADACDDIFTTHPERSYEENQAEVYKYLEAVKASCRRKPALLMASTWDSRLTTSYGTTDMHESILTFLPKQISRLNAYGQAFTVAHVMRRDIGWIGPPMGPGLSQDDWPLHVWGWVLVECQRSGYPMTLGLTTDYLSRQPAALRIIGDWKRRK